MTRRNTCISARMFAVWVGWIVFSQILAGAYSKSVLTTIERRFNLSSTIVALMSASYQIANMTILVFVSYFGPRYHRPRGLAVGCIIMTFGFAFLALPQFIGGRYEFDDISTNSSQGNRSLQITCEERARESVDEPNTCKTEDAKSESNIYLFIVAGFMIAGIGGTPIQPLGYSYVDDHANEHNSALYLGIINSIALVGPAAGYLMGGFFLKYWVDIGWVDTGKYFRKE